jgi:hypothetical protein
MLKAMAHVVSKTSGDGAGDRHIYRFFGDPSDRFIPDVAKYAFITSTFEVIPEYNSAPNLLIIQPEWRCGE